MTCTLVHASLLPQVYTPPTREEVQEKAQGKRG